MLNITEQLQQIMDQEARKPWSLFEVTVICISCWRVKGYVNRDGLIIFFLAPDPSTFILRKNLEGTSLTQYLFFILNIIVASCLAGPFTSHLQVHLHVL